MQEILRAYREADFPMRPAASQEALEAAQKALECVFPEPICALYTDHDGMEEAEPRLPMRLMLLEDVVDFHDVVREYGWNGWGLRVFWTDDNSNYAGLYVEGLLAGKVCWIDHGEIDPSPVYASVASFLRTQLEALSEELDWEEFPRDYPALTPASDPDVIAPDQKILQELYPKYQSSVEDERIYHAYCLMALTPYEQNDSLLAFTHDPDSYIQSRACEILAQRRYEPAIDRLAELVVSGAAPNTPSTAIRALGQIGTAEALARLHELLTTAPKHSAEIQRVLRYRR